MMSMPSRNPIPFDRPATYQISVQGRIDPNWADRLEGMTICLTTEEACPPVTTLEGELSDQAALPGVLNTLYELHLPVLLVLCQSYIPASGKSVLAETNPLRKQIMRRRGMVDQEEVQQEGVSCAGIAACAGARRIIGGAVIVAIGASATKMSQSEVQQVEQHTGKKAEIFQKNNWMLP